MSCIYFMNEAYKKIGEARQEGHGDAILAIENGEDYKAWLKEELQNKEKYSCLKFSKDDRVPEIVRILTVEEREKIFGKGWEPGGST